MKLMTRILCLAFGVACLPVVATTWYVSASGGSDANNGMSWVTAKASIQSAIDASSAGDTILVTNGVYAPISTSNKPISISSIEGSEPTIIDGAGAQRCAYLGEGSNECSTVLSGFTLRNGNVYISWGGLGGAGVRGGTLYDSVITNCQISGGWGGYGGEGGGAGGSRLHRCEIVGCRALAGGGANSCELHHCVIRGCYAYDDGGGLHCCYADNCLVIGNYGYNVGGSASGYGVCYGVAINCTIANNTGNSGGGVVSSTLYNSIIYENSPENIRQRDSRGVETILVHCCVDNPEFVDSANGDYRLSSESACVDAGDSGFVVDALDLSGKARISGASVDIGAFEFQHDGSDEVIWTTLVFDPNWGETALISNKYVSTSILRYLPSVSRPGYSFEGWFTSRSGGSNVGIGTAVASCPAILYAHWTEYSAAQRAALDITTNLGLGDNGTSVWTVDTSTYHTGNSSLRSAAIGDSQSTYQTLTVHGTGSVSFWWKVSSESNYDYLRCYVDGVEQAAISGEVDWQRKTVTFTAEGEHIIKWQYSKDGSVSSGSDCGWVDNVSLESAHEEDPGVPDDSDNPVVGNGLLHRWSFNGNLIDAVTGHAATPVGSVTTDGSCYVLPGGSRGVGYLDLGHVFPTNLPSMTLEIWATQISTRYYSHIVDVRGVMQMEWSLATMIGYDELGCVGIDIDNSGFCTHLAPYTLNTEFHISVVVDRLTDGTSKVSFCKRDGVSGEILKKCEYTSPAGWNLGSVQDDVLYLGHNCGSGREEEANAKYNEVRLWGRALSDAELQASVIAGADATIGGVVRHTVTFDPNGGEGGSLTRNCEDGEAIGPLPDVMRPGYVFLGWFSAIEGGGEIAAEMLAVSDLIVYARWAKEGEVMVLSARMRNDDPTILDVVYRVNSTNATANVRALAFENGEESFAKVVRPETFIDGTAANLGYAVPANTNLTLSWKVTDDWDVKLARVKFMILVEENFYPLPLDLVTIPANGSHCAVAFSTNEISAEEFRDALFWLYADHNEGLSLENGVLSAGGVTLANGAELVPSAAARYVFKTMGYSLLDGSELDYINETARLNLKSEGAEQHAFKQD